MALSRRRALRPAATAGVLLGLLLPWAGCGAQGRRVHDRADFLRASERTALEERLALLDRGLGVDVHLLFERLPAGTDLAAHAAMQVDALGVGRSRQQRGLLLDYDVANERLRLEVGYGLEALVPDAFAGYLVEDHVRVLFDADEPGLALLFAVRMLEDRIGAARLGNRFDPEVVEALRSLRHGSGGAGAEVPVPNGRSPARTLPALLPAAARARFAGAHSVQAAHRAYLEWLATGSFDPDVALFTPDTREYLRGLPMSRGYLEFVFLREAGQRTGVIERGDRALLYFRDDPRISPRFYVRGPQGWQLDLATSLAEIVGVAGGRFSWTFRDLERPALRPFRDEMLAVEGLWRLRDGDNRPLPGAPSS